jgi:hypothetical protein
VLGVSDRRIPIRRRKGSIRGSVVSRRAGSASTGRAVTRRGIRPRATSSDAISGIRTDARLCGWSRSTHDFVSDIPSLPGARFRHCRTACVGSGKSRPLPPPLVKGTACHDPGCLPSARSPFSLSEAPRSESCDAARVIHTLLARCFACAALRAEDLRKTEFCNLDTYDARATTGYRARCPLFTPHRRAVRVAC